MSDENLQNSSQKTTQTSFKTLLKETVKFIIIAVIIVAPIRYFVASPFIVSGSSMFPTFKNGQYLIIEKISYDLHPPERGDVIVFHYPLDQSKYFIKRVIGLPEETVIIRDGQVIIKNDEQPKGVKLTEEYIKNEDTGNFKTVLGEGEYFVMGDNRPVSSDSRYWGAVSQNLIVGRSYVRLLPLGSADFWPGKDQAVLYPKFHN